MTQDSEKPIAPEKSVDDSPARVEQPQVDFLLQAFVNVVNNAGIEIGITLCVGGIVVSGQLMSGKSYFEEVANDALQSPMPADQVAGRQAFSDQLRRIGNWVYAETANKEQSGNEDDEAINQLPAYIHLRNAKFFHNTGNPIPGNKGLWWRGRLSAVDGFSFGSFTSSI